MGPVVHLAEFEIKTGGRLDVVDVTNEVSDAVARSGIRDGQALVFVPHTTCAVMVANGKPDVAGTLKTEMDEIAPPDAYYEHDDLTLRTENLVEDEPANAPAHIFNVFRGSPSQRFPVSDGRLQVEESSRVLLVELCSSRLRRYYVQVIGSS
jgi:secondary thiamine-phosphate synthase enzyme